MSKDYNNQLLVKISETGDWIDIQPLISYLQSNALTGLPDALERATDDISNGIRFISTNLVPLDKGQITDFGKMTDLYNTFYDLRDMFDKISILTKKEA